MRLSIQGSASGLLRPADHTPSSPDTAQTTGAEGIQAELPETSLSPGATLNGDMDSRVAAMVITNAMHARQQAARQRDATEHVIEHFEQRQLDEMHRAADAYRQQAKVALTIGMLSSGATALGGMGGGAGTAGKALANGLDGAQKFADGQYSALQKNIEVQQTSAGNHVDAAKRRLEDTKDARDAANNLEDRAINFATTAVQIRGETERAMVFRG